ncbi:hypothetical protein [Pseudogemmobacter faecipullorum]|uniref:Glycosyltransferase family 2 protein n=1 Tax=Pseudogemmobacter faecipullorum TaxID=2755041 RepID=A0ABS8CL79_9RHOB|nr:hypothetical protein [Pseudogemmobacter faecipullorum]MCB5410138.1 hypothetical protein [Pseudogemmobacter faecipullorum]
MYQDKITMCLTIGRRPDLLRQTLETLRGLPPLPVIAINDFRDEETNAVFREFYPEGLLLDPGRHLGHHGAVDAMYAEVKTPYILHGEDDWGFTRTDFLADALKLLAADPQISVISLRATQDIPLTDADRARITTDQRDGVAFQRMEHLHEQWHGYTLNPHLAPKALWESLGGFSGFEKERHLSRHLRAKGMFVAYLLPEACRHIGEGRGADIRRHSLFRRFKKWLRGIKAA